MKASSSPSLPLSLNPASAQDPELARALAAYEQELQDAQSRGDEHGFADEAIPAEPTLEHYEAKRRQGMLGRVNEEVQKRILAYFPDVGLGIGLDGGGEPVGQIHAITAAAPSPAASSAAQEV